MNPLFETAAVLGIEALARPGIFAALGALTAVAVVAALRSHVRGFAWPGILEARVAGAHRFDGQRLAAILLRGGALAALAAVVAGPLAVHRAPPEPGQGLDLVLTLDVSGSMQALDAEMEGVRRTRLDLAREVVTRFATRRVAEGDRVALVVFAEQAFTQSPLSSDGALLGTALDRVDAGIAGQSTALGDALALSVKRALAGTPNEDSSAGPGAGRVVVLLTDGRSNAGTIPVDIAASIAAGEGVRVHTVGIGTAGAEVSMEREDVDPARGRRFERHDIDTQILERVATVTGGRFFAARRSSDLDAVYAEIDALERVPRRAPPRVRRSDRPEPLLAVAGSLLILEIALARLFRAPLP